MDGDIGLMRTKMGHRNLTILIVYLLFCYSYEIYYMIKLNEWKEVKSESKVLLTCAICIMLLVAPISTPFNILYDVFVRKP